jgi:hypothetical protein
MIDDPNFTATLEDLAKGIAATMSKTDKVFVIGDGHSGGMEVGPDMLSRHNRPIMYGVRRPELDGFAQMVREEHAGMWPHG